MNEAVHKVLARREAENEAVEALRGLWITLGFDLASLQLAAVRKFLRRLSFDAVYSAMEVVEAKVERTPALGGEDGPWRYFCGVCWNMIRANEEAHPEPSLRELPQLGQLKVTRTRRRRAPK